MSVGIVAGLIDGIANIVGTDLFANELLVIGETYGTGINLSMLLIKATIFGRDEQILEGDLVEREFIELTLKVGFWLIGRVIDPTAKFLDE
jgi:F0F1-type ATP synthase alpha subunit